MTPTKEIIAMNLSLRSLLLFSLSLSAAQAQALTVVGGSLFVGDAPKTLDETAVTDFAGNPLDSRYPEYILNDVIHGFREAPGCVQSAVALPYDILAYNNPAVDGVTFGGNMTWAPTGTAVNGIRPGNAYGGTLAANTTVQCFTFYMNSPNLQDPALADITQWGTGKPNKTVLGILYKEATLDAWDSVCSNGGDIFATGSRSLAEGLELDTSNHDGLQIDRANNTVTMQSRTPTDMDTIRVITSCN